MNTADLKDKEIKDISDAIIEGDRNESFKKYLKRKHKRHQEHRIKKSGKQFGKSYFKK